VSPQPDVDVVIALYRPGAWIDGCLASVRAQRNVAVRTILVDDDPDIPLAESLASTMPDAIAISSTRNRGYAAANNAGIAAGSAPFVLCLNQDARLAPDYLARLIALFRATPRLGAAAGKLLQLSTPSGTTDGTIDSAGLMMQDGRRVIDVGQGQVDRAQFGGRTEVFGVSAAAGVYRRAALDAVSTAGAVFDESFFMYKEDVDLAWRLRRAGFTAWVDGEAIGYHARSAGRQPIGGGLPGLLGLWAQERAKPTHVRRLSWRNQMLLIIKNEGRDSIGAALLPISLVQVMYACADLVLDPIGGLVNRLRLIALIPRALRQRDGRVTADLGRWLR
jgi:GT2 family glycosyltransferase